MSAVHDSKRLKTGVPVHTSVDYSESATTHVTGNSGTTVTITAYGGASEVGRSCIVVSYAGKRIMLDCGLHPGFSSIDSLPFFDLIDDVECASIDLVLVTHFHLDHIGSLPYFLARTKFQGRVFMTHPTKAIYRWILSDYVKVTTVADVFIQDDGSNTTNSTTNSRSLFTDADLAASMDRIETINFHQRMDVEGVVFTAYNAGHVLGAAMFDLEIDGVKILYTGDYSREEDRHLAAAEIPPGRRPDIVIVESTYGVQIHQPRKEREKMFTDLVSGIVLRGGRCLVPVFALGRAQELLLILEEYWHRHHSLLAHIPIYYASNLAERCMTVYQTYIHMMNARIRAQIKVANPFKFTYIRNLKRADRLADDAMPCVVFASPGMLQNGVSRELFEEWAVDPRSGCVLPGYCVDGTLAKRLQSQLDEFESLSGRRIPIRMSVHFVSFSAHADYAQTSEFINILRPAHVVLVHGDHNEMKRLRDALARDYSTIMKFHTPRNCQDIHLDFDKSVKAIIHTTPDIFTDTIDPLDQDKGAASKHALVGSRIRGLVIKTAQSYTQTIVAPGQLHLHTPLRATTINQRITVPYYSSPSLIKFYLENIFGANNVCEQDPTLSQNSLVPLTIYSELVLSMDAPNILALTYTAGTHNDVIADSIISAILYIESNPASVATVGQRCSHKHRDEEKQADADCIPVLLQHFDEVSEFLNEHFDNIAELLDDPLDESSSVDPRLLIQTDRSACTLNLLTGLASGTDPALNKRVQAIANHLLKLYNAKPGPY